MQISSPPDLSLRISRYAFKVLTPIAIIGDCPLTVRLRPPPGTLGRGACCHHPPSSCLISMISWILSPSVRRWLKAQLLQTTPSFWWVCPIFHFLNSDTQAPLPYTHPLTICQSSPHKRTSTHRSDDSLDFLHAFQMSASYFSDW